MTTIDDVRIASTPVCEVGHRWGATEYRAGAGWCRPCRDCDELLITHQQDEERARSLLLLPDIITSYVLDYSDGR